MKKQSLLLVAMSFLMLCGCSNGTSTIPESERVNLLEDGVNEYINGIKGIKEFENSKLDHQKEYKLEMPEQNINYEFHLSLNKDNLNPIVYQNVINNLTLTNLQVDTTYYGNIVLNGNVVSSVSFTTQSYAPRIMNVDGINNVRDIGGWSYAKNKKIAQGLIFRGSEMNNKYNITEEGIKVMKESVKIKTDIDLRTDREANNIKTSPLGSEVNYLHIPSFSGYSSVNKNDQIENYKKVFKALANPSNYPMYIHCYQGADRTGTIISMIEGLMGVSDEDRLKDYNLTTFSSGEDAFRDGSTGKYPFVKNNVQALYPAKSFKESMEKFVTDRLGLTKDEVNSIRKILSGEEAVTRSDFALRK